MEAAMGVEGVINTINQIQQKQTLFSVSLRKSFFYNHPSRLACSVSAGGQRGRSHRPTGQRLCCGLPSWFIPSPGSSPSASRSHGAAIGLPLALGMLAAQLQPKCMLTPNNPDDTGCGHKRFITFFI